MYRKVFKRLLDLILSSLLIIILSPILIVTSLIVAIKLGRPVLFKQVRPGLQGKLFTMYKFRTMSDEKNFDGELKPDSERLNRFGKTLRSTSIDELPELINIFKGEMSFVGPRPLLVEYLDLYNNEQSRRHNVRPGLTGLAQVNGRNAITWPQKFEYDLEYVDNISFINDIRIIILTFKTVLFRDNINATDSVTVEKFTGN